MLHSSDAHRLIAEGNTVLRGQVGSGLHGVTAGDDDRDEMGVCIEPPECVIGLRRFEQYIFRTQPEGVRSGPGDLDLVVYSLRKWARLAAAGNPTVLLLLFIPDQELTVSTDVGHDVQRHPERFLSRVAGRKFLGYLNSQRRRLTGDLSRRTNRPELIERYGFDTKFAYHALRLGIQGIELMERGRITLPMPQPYRSQLVDVRQGKYTLPDVLGWLDEVTARLESLTATADLPEQPDRMIIDNWLVEIYQRHWEA
ncbi:DNA polymerase beta superfamily protein [Mycobacteroides franklinii]|uniref:Nucleotidyltransferase n=1 Tax=Mycobacteroides franklinii TaxID=948102 RepID=A0A4V3A694_9MYCO|nr:nucleotidyltransferase domain-containing protein [Mycobacteroides franklinii]ORA60575.1 nucleotidyltransferase [Mycobacteroides franklinii]TDH22258.1 nucleotidyltransferase [Mycobacteroides franklinii]TDZ43866.1 putative nucleotidyltransferase [Mycobacteroides franklinii]TDZ51001.1 putative nucleotidyltransferase [Mycobacteroides franklinii]TDZ57421.1 putative nucleotidyltransferase [Mycobacteroides franklinii]